MTVELVVEDNMHIQRQIFGYELEVIGSLSQRVIEQRVEELRDQDRLTMALRSALRRGVDINDLSEVSGLTPDEISKRVERELFVESDDLMALVEA